VIALSRPAAKRLVVVALVALVAAGACTSDSAEECPGEAVATLAFTGVRVSQGALDPALEPDPAAPDCEAGLGYPAELAPFTGAVSTDPASGTAALCRTGEGAQPLYGTLASGRLAVETATDGAVLGSPCAEGCVATLALALRGSFSGTGPELRFDGAVVERLAVRAGAACGGCALPCAARYAVTGLPVPP
jgi:hypothetical protein